MKLYFAPGACSLSPHIVLRESGLPFETDRIDGKTHKTQNGSDYYAINPKGQVPALQLDSGEVLTEGAVIVQYIADQKPESKLAPPAGNLERYRLQEWLSFIATEMHKGSSPLFNPKLPGDVKQTTLDRLLQRYAFVARHLDTHTYLMGDHFTVADAYLFTILRWAKRFEIDLNRWPSLAAFMKRMEARPSVKATLEAEGLLV
jgi:glutathione S-transferase